MSTQPTHMCSLDELSGIFQKHKDQAYQDYFTFLRFKSVSSEPAFSSEVTACANWLTAFLSQIGFQTELWPTTGHPTIFASNMSAGPNKPTLLIYNHYDVQPADSTIKTWLSDPFEPTIRDEEVYARGAQDNKGQCFYTILALKALLENNKTLPINIKLCIEGEEECGSVGLSKILQQKKHELKADYLVVVDVGLQERNMPAVTLGVRGLVTMDVAVHGTKTDLHSGSHGGLAFNPIHALAQHLASLRDCSGKISVPGFYDDVVALTDQEQSELGSSFDESKYEKMFGAPPTGGEKEFSAGIRVAARPTIEVNGISGGYCGPGFKTVIPASAYAKISCRLVPNQDPQKIGSQVARFLQSQAPYGTSVEVKVHPGCGKALRASPYSAVVQAFGQAFSQVLDKPCAYHFDGASIPIVVELAEVCKAQVVLVGLGLPDDQIHAPNEHFGLDRIEKGFMIMMRAIELLGQLRTVNNK